MDKRKPLVQWTIRELVAVLSVGTVVLGSIWAGEIVSFMVLLLAMQIVMAWLVIAVVGKGEWRTFALGSSVIGGLFVMATILSDGNLIRASDGSPYVLPTTSLATQLRQVVTRYDLYQDGKRLPNSDKLVVGADGTVKDAEGKIVGEMYGTGGNFGGGGGMMGPKPATPPIIRRPFPQTSVFETCSHVFWLLMLSYVGGKFAVAFARYQRNAELAEAVGQESTLDG